MKRSSSCDSCSDASSSDSVKRQRYNNQPSSVLHVRSLPTFTTESDVHQLFSSYGSVVRVLLLPSAHQAFVQLCDVDAATRAYEASKVPPGFHIKGRQIFLGYSNRKEIVIGNASSTPSLPSSSSSSAQPLHAHTQPQPFTSAAYTIAPFTASYTPNTNNISSSSTPTEPPSPILLLSVSNCRVPVTLDHIYQICKPYGHVLKIVTFNKNDIFKALVQYSTLEAAVAAAAILQGKDIFLGCCHVRVNYSSLSDLKISNNTNKARDFTLSGSAPHMFPNNNFFQQLPYASNLNLINPFTMQPPSLPSFVSSSAQSVVLVSSLPTELHLLPDQLFNLFSMYGDVLRIKILFNKRDTALVQYPSSQQASYAIQFLHHFPLLSSKVSVAHSKHNEISLPKDNAAEEAKLTKDYTNSQIHRFKSKPVTTKNLFGPSQVLYVASIPENVTEDELRQIFVHSSVTSSPIIQFFSQSKTQAYARFSSISDGVVALMHTHNIKLKGRYLRVSFSNKDPNAITQDSSTTQPAAASTEQDEQEEEQLENSMELNGEDAPVEQNEE